MALRESVQESMYDLKGHLFFPEFLLMIDTPFRCVDIHGMGECKGHHSGAWHCVVSSHAVLDPSEFRSQVIDLDSYPTSTIEFTVPWKEGEDKCTTVSVSFACLFQYQNSL